MARRERHDLARLEGRFEGRLDMMKALRGLVQEAEAQQVAAWNDLEAARGTALRKEEARSERKRQRDRDWHAEQRCRSQRQKQDIEDENATHGSAGLIITAPHKNNVAVIADVLAGLAGPTLADVDGGLVNQAGPAAVPVNPNISASNLDMDSVSDSSSCRSLTDNGWDIVC